MPRYVALLRGINLGPSKRIAMAELRSLVGDLGYGDPRTLLQSGNVALTSDRSADAVAAELEGQIAERLGVETRVVVRTRDELADVVARNPLGDVADDPKRYQVSFLSGEPEEEAVRAIAAADVEPERIVVDGREIFVWHANGIQRSPASRLVDDKRLGVASTARNWNTVTKLLALADERKGR